MLRSCVPMLKVPPVPAAQRFHQYYNRHKELILLSKREISPLLIKQRRLREQKERYMEAIAKLLAPYCYQKTTRSSPSPAPSPTEIEASIAMLTQAHRTTTNSGIRLKLKIRAARNGQKELRVNYHNLYRQAQKDPTLEAKLVALLENRRAAAVPVKSLIEEGKRSR